RHTRFSRTGVQTGALPISVINDRSGPGGASKLRRQRSSHGSAPPSQRCDKCCSRGATGGVDPEVAGAPSHCTTTSCKATKPAGFLAYSLRLPALLITTYLLIGRQYPDAANHSPVRRRPAACCPGRAC